jgi:hypothetical protein
LPFCSPYLPQKVYLYYSNSSSPEKMLELNIVYLN